MGQSRVVLPRVIPRAYLHKIRVFIERLCIGANPFGCKRIRWSEGCYETPTLVRSTHGWYWVRSPTDPITKGGWVRNGELFAQQIWNLCSTALTGTLFFILFSTPLQLSCLKIRVSLLLLEKDNKIWKIFSFSLNSKRRKEGVEICYLMLSCCYISAYMTKWHNLGSNFRYQE